MIELKGLVVLNGDVIDLEKLKQIGKKSDFILCADGGVRHIIRAGLVPDLVIGDLDSIYKEYLDLLMEKNIPIEKFPVKKDKTDSELCIEYMINKGARYITIVGAIGSRIDHTLANIFLLDKINENGISGEIVNRYNTIYLVTEEMKLLNKEGYFVSVVPISSQGATVTLRGFEYNLDRVRIDFASTHGVSNKIILKEGYIKVHEGKCLIVISKD